MPVTAPGQGSLDLLQGGLDLWQSGLDLLQGGLDLWQSGLDLQHGWHGRLEK